MQMIDETREHCRFVGKGLEKMLVDGKDLRDTYKLLTCPKPPTVKERSIMKKIKWSFCVAIGFSFSVVCHGQVSTNVVNKLIETGEYELAAEHLFINVDEGMSKDDIDRMIAWIEKLTTKLRTVAPSKAVKRFVPPDREKCYEKVRAQQPWWARAVISTSRWAIEWGNDAQRVVVINRFLNQTPLMSADEAQKEIARFDAVKKVVEEVRKVVASRCIIESKEHAHYVKVKQKLDSIKQRLKNNRTRFLSYEVVSPYLYQAHCHMFAGTDADARISSVNRRFKDEEIKGYRTEGVKLLAKACHKEWLYSCSQDVREQFIEVQQYMKENVQEREYEEYKVIQTLTDCIEPSKVRGADAWWK